MIGNDGNDTINDYGGPDTIKGSLGADLLNGSAGAETRSPSLRRRSPPSSACRPRIVVSRA
ncbi:hypothetical protein [Methylobacterium nodulans]|uniref:hypothetical protein n=1 Tax=Methylobacterium nodulans TaxID=114616 RepID=UPI0018DD46D3